jgi:hypothetical protein
VLVDSILCSRLISVEHFLFFSNDSLRKRILCKLKKRDFLLELKKFAQRSDQQDGVTVTIQSAKRIKAKCYNYRTVELAATTARRAGSGR